MTRLKLYPRKPVSHGRMSCRKRVKVADIAFSIGITTEKGLKWTNVNCDKNAYFVVKFKKSVHNGMQFRENV